MTTLTSEEIRRYAELADPHDFALDLATRMVVCSRDAHDRDALTRWLRRYTDLADGTEALPI
jgi:hypothetical protein